MVERRGELLLAGAQRLLRLPALGDVALHGDEDLLPANVREAALDLNVDPAPVLPPMLDVEQVLPPFLQPVHALQMLIRRDRRLDHRDGLPHEFRPQEAIGTQRGLIRVDDEGTPRLAQFQHQNVIARLLEQHPVAGFALLQVRHGR